MNQPRRSFISRSLHRLKSAWTRRRQRPETERKTRMEFLEPRLALTITSPLPDPLAHIHPVLKMYVEGQEVVIPKDMGLTSTGHFNPHTHDFTGTLHVGEGGPAGLGTTIRNVTLADFFDVWRTENVGQSTNNPNAILDTNLTDGTNLPRFLNKTVDASHVLRMWVQEEGDGAPELEYASNSSSNSIAHPEDYVPRDHDLVIIRYDAIGTNVDAPEFDPIATQTVLGGAPSWIALNGFDPNGGPLTYTVQSGNPNLVQASIESGNRSIAVDVIGYGTMKFQLFDDLAPDVTNRMVQLINAGFYNKTATNQITFHRVINNFVIQAGDPTGTGSGGSTLGDFDDEFNVDLQHTSSGLLSMAKSSDDTNDSQFFITDAPTRSLDFNHSIWGRLTEGEAIRDAINSVPTDSNDKPTTPIVINSISVFNDTENGVLKLKAAEGASGTTSVTVTVSDQQGHQFSQTFQVTVTPDTSNSAPFLINPAVPVHGVTGQPIQLQLQATDVENNPNFFDAVKPSSETVNYTVTADHNTGLVTITPPAGFTGTFNVLVGVSGATQANTVDTFDTQLVPVTVSAAAPTVDLQAGSDTGLSPSDNVTNAGTLNFDITGVTSGAIVKLKEGSTILAQGTATGTSITLSTTQIATLGEGIHHVTATQTVGGVEGAASAVLDVTYDITPPAAFTTTPPTEADVGTLLTYNADNPEEGGVGFHYALVTPPTGATINAATGALTWTPNDTQVGTQAFGISAIDAAGNIRTQSLSVAVTQPLPPKVDLVLTLTKPDGSPVTSLASGQSFILKVQTRDLRVPARGVFAAYMDILWDSTKATVNGPITYGSEYGTQHSGTASAGQIDEVGAVAGSNELGQGLHDLFSIPMVANGSGTLTFVADPADNLPAHDALVYGQNSAVNDEVRFGSVSISVNASFNAVNDTFNVDEDSTNSSLTPLANDTNIGNNQNTLTISAVGTTDHGGTVTIASDGKSLIYTPAANFSGTETFTYTAKNQNNETNTATIAVQVQPKNDPPTGVNDTFTVPEDSSNFVLDVLANDLTAPDTGETLIVTQVGTGNHGGTLTIGNGGANIRYTPALNFVGTETFTYTLSDRATGGLTSTASVTVTVTETNDPPVAGNDTATVAEDSGDTTINVLTNDTTGPDTGETLSVIAVSNASNGGTISVASGNQGVVYRPAPNFQGTETFTYTLADSRGGTATGVVTVTVTNSNDPPTAVNDAVTGFKNTTIKYDVLANDTSAPDPAESLIVDTVTQPAHGTVSITDNGTRVSYTPATDYQGPDSFTYTIKDPGGLTSTAATVNITVAEFVPSTLSGFVYFDVDNDGQRDSGELPLSGVTITLTGTTVNSQAVNLTVKTGNDGSYRFGNLAPGSYTLKENQPSFTIDGKDTAGSSGGTATNDQIVIASLAAGSTAANYNFGERGRALETLSIKDLFSSNSRNYAITAVDSTGAELWHSMSGPAWTGYADALFSLTGSTALRFQATNPSSQPVFGTISTTSDKLNLLGTSGGNKLYLVRNGLTNLPLTPVGANRAPVGIANSYTTNEDTVLNVPVATGVLSNDTDADANVLTAAVVAQPAHGTLTLNANGSFAYTPAANFSGTDTFTYKASDGTAQSDVTTVTINITAVNDPPVVANNSYVATLNTPLNISAAAGLLANDSDVESTLTATALTQPTHGTLSLNSNGSFTYTPMTGFTGADTFTYRASDGSLTADGTVTLTVVAVNQAPTAVANSYTTAEDTTLTVPVATGVLANDTDPENNALTAVVTAQPTHGTLTFNSNGSFSYIPSPNFNGSDTFTYTATDGSQTSAAATVTITVTAVNDGPSAVANSYSTPAGTPLVVNAAQGVLANDTDVDGQTLTATVLTQPTNGTVTMASDGSFTYTPNAGFSGTNTFTYRATDGALTSDATVTITVTSGNSAPVANNDTYSTNEDVPLTVAVASSVLANDTDSNANPLTAIIVALPGHGTLNFNNNGTFTYTPAANFHGTDTFTYKANDGSADSNVATATITVNALNDAPVAVADSYNTEQGQTLTIDVDAGVLDNDTDVDQQTLTAVLVTQAQNGTVSLAANGSFIYTPTAGFHGIDTFTYKANDGSADSNTVTATIDVNGPPAATADSYTTDEDQPLVVAVGDGVLHNDTDPDGDTLTVMVVAQPTHGTLAMNDNGAFTYTPDANFHGADSFTYKAQDATSSSATTTVSLTITSVNDAPLAGLDSFTVGEGGTLNIAAPGLLTNDTDADQDSLTAVFVSDPAHGDLTLNANGSFTYTPDAGFHGDDTFVYQASDGTLQSTNSTVTIHVNGLPTAVNDAYEVDEDGTLTVDENEGVVSNDSDPENDDIHSSLVADVQHGSLTLSPHGSFVYTPNPDFHGTDGFSYKVNDGHGDSLVAAVTITVNPINDAPVAADHSFTTPQNTPLVIDVPGLLAGATDGDGDDLDAAKSSDPLHGTVTVNADGSFTYTPAAGYHGSDTFNFSVSDGSLQDTATVTIQVNSAPVAADDSYETDEDTTLTVNVVDGLLHNDTDADSDTLAVTILASPAHGQLTPNPDGSFSYTPTANYNGPDSFTYKVNDGVADSGIATVTLTVNAIDDAPVGVDNSFSVDQDQTLTVNAVDGVLTNDTDVDGPAKTANTTPVSGPSHGQLTLNADGSFTYTPDAGYFGPDSFVYEVSDGTLTDQATVSITVNEAGEGGQGGEGESAGDAALLSWLTGGDHLAGESTGGDWQSAVDQAFSELG